MPSLVLRAAPGLWLLAPAALALRLWASPDAIPTGVPAACRAELARDIACEGLVTPAQAVSGRALTGHIASRYCTAACYDALRAFRAAVDENCGSIPYRLHNSSLVQSAAELAAGLVWAHSLSCIHDSSGFCLADLYAGTKDACSECALKYGAAMVGSDWGQAAVSPDSFSSLLSSCRADPSSYPYEHLSTPTAKTTPRTATGLPTCTGIEYTVKEGDSCESISRNAIVATDRMISLNHLDYNCSTLVADMTLCLQDTCAIQTVTHNQTCSSIAKGKGFSRIQLISWNPTIHADCGNLDNMVGRSICVSPPEAAFNVYSSIPLKQRPTLASSMFSSWVQATALATYANFTTSWYTPTLDPDVAPATQTNSYNATRASLVAQRTKHCWINDDVWDVGFNRDDLPAGCQPLLDEHCFPGPDAPVPTSPAHIPAACTPAEARTSVLRMATARATRTPIQPGGSRFYSGSDSGVSTGHRVPTSGQGPSVGISTAGGK